uniref:ATP-dependent RNA helicase n=1 Tax=Panagrellus redivivus TaxID=6233 RepID=A0A7E4US10_PANRE
MNVVRVRTQLSTNTSLHSHHENCCTQKPQTCNKMNVPNPQKKIFKRKLEKFKKKDKNLTVKSAVEEPEEAETVAESIADEPETVEPAAKKSKDSAEIRPQDKAASVVQKNVLTDVKFDTLQDQISPKLLEAIKAMGYEYMTEIQAKCMPPLLKGNDIRGLAKTGSGKTLAFLVPAIQLLLKLKWKPYQGTGIIVISPTRELSMQTYGVLCEFMEHFPSLTHGMLMGGANRDTEAKKLVKGVSFLVTTPGRLLDHLQNTEGFMFKNLVGLIIDEADRILDIGFELDIKRILRILPKRRQTMLFSATHSPKVDELLKQAVQADVTCIEVIRPEATVVGLQQGFVVCESEKRFLLLFTFLKKNRGKKVMVFFSSCASVRFHHELLNFIDIPVQCIHGKQKQQKRTATFFGFCNDTTGILLCTDVAARGLDIPKVDWIVQYDPPDDPREYIHRVGRTARGEGGTGSALLFLRPEELGFLRYLKNAKVTLDEFEFSTNKVANVQPQLEKLIRENYYLNIAAKEAYKGYVRAYDSHSLKQIYSVNHLDLLKVSQSFGFDVPPFVDLPIAHKNKLEGREKSSGAGYKKKKGKAFQKF